MDTSLSANARPENHGKGGARKLRATGRIPGVIYGRGREATPVDLDPGALDLIFRTTRNRNTVLNLQVDGETIPCLVREAQRHPLTREILHVDLYALERDQVVTVDVPVEPHGKPAGASIGGRLRVIRRTLEVRCKYQDIPETIPVDTTPMNIGDFIKVSEIPTAEGVELVHDVDFNVLSLYGKKQVAAPQAPKKKDKK